MISIPANSTVQHVTVERGRVRLLFLDGIRGLCALYIALFHAHWQISWNFQPVHLTGITALLYSILDLGHWAVAVFIVLSGYCLMLPVARAGNLTIPGGISGYLWRRARRILPPYYAALALSLTLITFVSYMRTPGGERWAVTVPSLTLGPILSHLLIVSCFSPSWFSKIDPPMWSVGVEWWIYFLFPAVLLPLWRRLGMYATVLIIVILTVGCHWLPGQPFDFFCPWYFALFAMGSAGAYINFSIPAIPARQWNWTMLIGIASGFAVIIMIFARKWFFFHPFITDILLGGGVTIFIVWCASKAQYSNERNVLTKVLESPLPLWLGTMSYSLYLVHDPVIALISPHIRATRYSVEAQFYAHIIFSVIISIVIGYGFHRVFERPFMLGHPKSTAKIKISAVLEPAP